MKFKRCLACLFYQGHKTLTGINFYSKCPKNGLLLFPSRIIPMTGSIQCDEYAQKTKGVV